MWVNRDSACGTWGGPLLNDAAVWCCCAQTARHELSLTPSRKMCIVDVYFYPCTYVSMQVPLFCLNYKPSGSWSAEHLWVWGLIAMPLLTVTHPALPSTSQEDIFTRGGHLPQLPHWLFPGAGGLCSLDIFCSEAAFPCIMAAEQPPLSIVQHVKTPYGFVNSNRGKWNRGRRGILGNSCGIPIRLLPCPFLGSPIVSRPC